jgi:transposase
MGFPGCYGSMSRQIRYIREAMPRKTKTISTKKEAPKAKPPVVRPFSTKQIAWFFVKAVDDLDSEQSAYLIRLLDVSEDFKQLYEFSQQFWSIVKEKKKDEFSVWLTAVKRCGITELRNFALGLQKDLSAVQAALTYKWSNGPVEGHNNRLKMIKRQMYGRAKFDLLRLRVLYS